MYAVVQIFEAGRRPASDVPEAARAHGEAAGFVTLLAISEDDGALVTVEIVETLDDLKAVQRVAARDAESSPFEGGPEAGRTITGELVFQRGL